MREEPTRSSVDGSGPGAGGEGPGLGGASRHGAGGRGPMGAEALGSVISARPPRVRVRRKLLGEEGPPCSLGFVSLQRMLGCSANSEVTDASRRQLWHQRPHRLCQFRLSQAQSQRREVLKPEETEALSSMTALRSKGRRRQRPRSPAAARGSLAHALQ